MWNLFRVSTCGFLVLLSNFYPEHYFTAIMLIVLDISSHWFHVMRFYFNFRIYVHDLKGIYGSVSGHHKSKESLQNRNALLQWYYSIYPLFGYCCVGTELFYILLYVLRFHPDPIIHQVRVIFNRKTARLILMNIFCRYVSMDAFQLVLWSKL